MVVGVYRSNTFPIADVDIFTTTLFGVLDQINAEKKKCVILGDMNIDLLKYGCNGQTDRYVDGVFPRGFVPQILRPTRITHCSATLIDHIISNDLCPPLPLVLL